MALDPLIAESLAQIEAAGAPSHEELGPVEARRTYREAALARRAGLTPQQVDHVEDLTIPLAEGPGGARLYRPAGADLPLVVYLHGGGWVLGDLDTHDPHARAVAAGARVAVLAIDYRLAPEHPFPAAHADAWAAVTWAADHAADLGADPQRIGVAGDSAGGLLAAATAVRARDEGLPLAVQGLIYPAMDATMAQPSVRDLADGPGLTASGMAWFYQQYLPTPDQEGFSPLEGTDLTGVAPAVVATAQYDLLHDEGELYASRLLQAGVPTVGLQCAGMVHAFLGMGHVSPSAGGAITAVTAAIGALVRR